ncbi:acetyl-CoA synthetase-like protein [Serendipita vermifera]|nr:acetyl-CoA synthetase-like protein [Serendipita vermifera]
MISLTDEYTVALGIAALTAYFASKILVPPSLVHPLLLGRQSHVAQVRKQNESAIYRNYGTGISHLPIAPGKGVVNQVSLLKLDPSTSNDERWLWNKKITNAQLASRVNRMGAALCSACGLLPKGSRALLLLDESLEWLIADLALATYCVPTISLSSISLLSESLEAHPPNVIIVQSTFLGSLLELLVESRNTSVVVVVVGDHTNEVQKKWSRKVDTRIILWEDLERTEVDLASTSPPVPADVSSAHFFEIQNSNLRGVQFTHQNIVAGATAVLNIFPTIGTWSAKDSVVSTHNVSTPYGRSILYAALYGGAHFTTVVPEIKTSGTSNGTLEDLIRACDHPERPPPTLLFIAPKYLDLLTSKILAFSKKSLFFWLAWRHKHAGILRGYLVRDGIPDRYVFSPARELAFGRVLANLRAIAICGDVIDSSTILPARIALSVPLVFTYASPLSTGPVFASHPLDMQVQEDVSKGANLDPLEIKKAHCGPPLSNMEVKLATIHEEAVVAGADPDGELYIRGPGVGDPVPIGMQLEDGWVDSGMTARVRTNGTFIVGNRRVVPDASTHDFTLI